MNEALDIRLMVSAWPDRDALQRERDLARAAVQIPLLPVALEPIPPLHAICRALAGSTAVTFFVSGFGDEPWPVSVDRDLEPVLIQLPDVLDALRRQAVHVELDFPGEGIERLLTIEAGKPAQVEIMCIASDAAWEPRPAMIEMPRKALIAMLEQLVKTFVRAARVWCPEEITRAEFVSWDASFGTHFQR
jgi:hypothetical protein